MADPDSSYAPRSLDLSAFDTAAFNDPNAGGVGPTGGSPFHPGQYSTFDPHQPHLAPPHHHYAPHQQHPHNQQEGFQPAGPMHPFSPYQQPLQQQHLQQQQPQSYYPEPIDFSLETPVDDVFGDDGGEEGVIRGRGRGGRGRNKAPANAVEEIPVDPTGGPSKGIDVKTKFPVARIKRIMQADEDVGKVAQVTPVAVAKSLEIFMISLITRAADEAKARNSKRVTAVHLKQTIVSAEEFDFLLEKVDKVPDAPPPASDDGSGGGGGGAAAAGGPSETRGGERRKRRVTRKKAEDSDGF